MHNIELKSFAKINLSLEVINKRKDNYHNIDTIMQEISLKDIVRLEKRKSDIIVSSNSNSIPLNKDNLVYKASKEVMDYTGQYFGIKIDIEKNIPIGAGLAGGSSNAAACIKGLNILYKLGLSLDEMKKIGVKVGADVPFCLEGGTMRAKGIGDKLFKISKFKDKSILIVNPSIHISTPRVYKQLNIDDKERESNIDKIQYYLENNDIVGLGKSMTNSMETVVIKKYPVIGKIKNIMIENGALGSLMSGSGSTVFGIFSNEEDIKKCFNILKDKYEKTYIVKTR